MGLYTGAVRNLHRAPYRVQVLTHFIDLGLAQELSPDEEAKIARVSRFLSAIDCAREIGEARDRSPRRSRRAE